LRCTLSKLTWLLGALIFGLSFLFALLPLFVIDSQTFVSNIFETLSMKGDWVSSNYLGDCADLCAVPSIDRFALVGGSNTESLVIQKGIATHSNHKATCRRHDGKQRVGGRVTQEILLKRPFRVDVRNRLFGESRSCITGSSACDKLCQSAKTIGGIHRFVEESFRERE